MLLRLLPRSATGQPISTYVSVMRRRRSASATGQKNFHVVLVDNGRSKLIGTEAQDVLRCIRCSACINHCPIYGAIGGHAYGATYMGPIGAALNPGMLSVAEAAHHANASTFCGRCAEVCPVMIPLPKIMRHWRAWNIAEGLRRNLTRSGLACGRSRRSGRRSIASARAWRASSELLGHARQSCTLPVMRGWFAVRDFRRRRARPFTSNGGPQGARHERARDDILSRIRTRRLAQAPRPPLSRAGAARPIWPRVRGASAPARTPRVRRRHRAPTMRRTPSQTSCAAATAPAQLHLPPESDSPRCRGQVDAQARRPRPAGPERRAAFAAAPYAIAETGTLGLPFGARRARVVAFPPGLEIVAVVACADPARTRGRAGAALAQGMPSTLNLVTGPSRTGDIEQTMEIGAHGPKELHILVCD